MNSARMHCSLKKVNICGYCLLNSSRTPQKRLKTKNKKKKKKKKRTKKMKTQLHLNADATSAIQTST